MKETISVIGEYSLVLRSGNQFSGTGEYTFTHKTSKERLIKTTIFCEKKRIIASSDNIEVDTTILAELTSLDRYDADKMTDDCRSFTESHSATIRDSIRITLSLIKYYLRHYDIEESCFSINSEGWKKHDQFKCFPSALSISLRNFSHYPLNQVSTQYIQSSIDEKIEPLVAMRHLHRAKHEQFAHHSWIDATIAAELAIKEVLCRARPELEALLLEMPSPPLSKLYGSLLRTYLGEESPYKKDLIRGQEVRNKLVHRPGKEKIDMASAIKYTDAVEGAIFHLLSLLYPNNKLINWSK